MPLPPRRSRSTQPSIHSSPYWPRNMDSIMDTNRGYSNTVNSRIPRTTPRFFWQTQARKRARTVRPLSRHSRASISSQISHARMVRHAGSCTRRPRLTTTRIKIILTHNQHRLPHARIRSPRGLPTRTQDETTGAPSRPCPSMRMSYWLAPCKWESRAGTRQKEDVRTSKLGLLRQTPRICSRGCSPVTTIKCWSRKGEAIASRSRVSLSWTPRLESRSRTKPRG